MIYLALHLALLPLLWALFYLLFNTLAGDTARWRLVWLIGALVDVWVNVTWGTILFLQLPNVKRLFLSARMDDLIVHGSGWRQWLALQIVGRLLEPYDKTGQHTTYGLQP